MDLVAAAETQTLGRRNVQISQVGVAEAQSYYSRGLWWERVERCQEGATSRGPRRLPEAGAGGKQILPWNLQEETACEALP